MAVAPQIIKNTANLRLESGVSPYRPGVAAQVEKIRAQIQQSGESRVGCDELIFLCPDEVSQSEELKGIAQIAEWERWTFEYLPDGSVRFSSLERIATSANRSRRAKVSRPRPAKRSSGNASQK